MQRGFLYILLLILIVSLSYSKPMSEFPKSEKNLLLNHIRELSSDSYEGRAPGTEGENKTVAYIESQFRNLGLKPGNTDGTYIQKVPMVGITPDPSMVLSFQKDGKEKKELHYLNDFVAWTRQLVPSIDLKNSELLFVGYGVQAPEFNWDDYKNVDVRGKTLVMLISDPPVPDPKNPDQLDPKVFGGKAMTYYGRWTYKFEIGGEKGAAGVLLVHETAPAGYPWDVVKGFSGESFSLANTGVLKEKTDIEGWITLEQTKQLFSLAGQDFDSLKKLAATRAFHPVPLGIHASLSIHNQIREISSRNVLAKFEGSDPKLKDEYIIYMAHWDHLGIGEPVKGDRVYHGAFDNASGVAGLIELARAFTKLATPPKRSILFLADTGEEQGLLGTGFYARNPVYPLAKTLAAINMDGLNVYGRTKDLVLVGLGHSELDDFAQKAAAQQNRVLAPDPEPEKGFYYRADHFEFALQGVPAMNPEGGIDFIDKPDGYGRKIRAEFTANDYHKPSDIIKSNWDLSGAVEDLQLLGIAGLDIANAKRYPRWKPGTEFKAKREAQLKAASNGDTSLY
jgi:Zn-dependent M28 family amino/carboxypeptidase